jgi:hypothetical protein
VFKSQPSIGWMLCSAAGGISSPQGFRILQESVIPVRAEPTPAIICKLDQNESCRKKCAVCCSLSVFTASQQLATDSRPRDQSSRPCWDKTFLLSTSSRPILGLTHLPIQWVSASLSPAVKWPGCEADHSPPISAEVNNTWIQTFTPNMSSWHSA